ncbi:MAG: hypothetical protein MJZ23_02110 [Paludibacteraceae bacterium]|nr:hypothetical protein [Paludibacteraceae bacterium]
MKHKDYTNSKMIYPGVYSSTIFEMEVWALYDMSDYTQEDYEEDLQHGCMDCGLRKEKIGLFETKEQALNCLDMMYEDPWSSDSELYCAFIREKPMQCMMERQDNYIKEWTYVHGKLVDESIVRNYDERNNPFPGRNESMIRFKRGDIVMIPDGYSAYWGIVWGCPLTIEKVQEMLDSFIEKYGEYISTLEYGDDQYTILTTGEGFEGGHEHILAHTLLPATAVLDYVRTTLEKGYKKAEADEIAYRKKHS